MADHVKIFLIDGGGNQGIFSLPASANKTQIDAFCNLYSICGVLRGQKSEQQSCTITAPDAGSNVDRAVKCLFVLGQEKIQFSSLSPKEIGVVRRGSGRVMSMAEKSLFLGDWKTAQGLSGAYTLRRNRFLQHI